MKSIKLSTWAKENGYSYQGAYDLFMRNELPGAYRLPSGSIRVKQMMPDIQPAADYTVIYCRVSTPKQKEDLIRQVESAKSFCAANGWAVEQVYKEVASGMNDNRQQLNRLLSNERITRVVVTNKDRLTRFGFNYLNTYFCKIKCELVVMDKTTECQQDLMSDFVSVITSMAARVYGLRRHKSHVEKILAQVEK